MIKPSRSPKEFVDELCSVVRRKLKEKVDLEQIIEEEVEERFALR